MIDQPLVQELSTLLPHDRIRLREPMSAHTSFQIGGPADVLIAPASLNELKVSLAWVRRHGIPVTIIGNGTNLLVRDKGIRGLVVKIAGNLSAVSFRGTNVTAEAGLPLADLSRIAAERGLTGLEFACGIPGTLGGAVVMNAGAYGGEMKDVVARVSVIDLEGAEATLNRGDLGFGYRKSSLQRGDRIVISVDLELKEGDAGAIAAVMEDLQKRRKAKQPLDWPSAGSVFKRPEGHFTGQLIEGAGLKGARVGDAQVSEIHSGFIVNRGRATAADVLGLIRRIQEEVLSRSSVRLVPEIRIIGEE